ncbi:uncharacterized protein LOC106879838 [Octopus bimaculoides]|nr:uncharacterized protein LOC106879838 [Octopus bimaculoides]
MCDHHQMAARLSQYGGHGNDSRTLWSKQEQQQQQHHHQQHQSHYVQQQTRPQLQQSERDSSSYQPMKRDDFDHRPVSVTSHTSSETEDSQNRDSLTTVLLPSSPLASSGKPGRRDQVSIDLSSLPDINSERARFRTLEESRRQIFTKRFPSAPYKPIKPLTRKPFCLTFWSSLLFFFAALLTFFPFYAIIFAFFPICVFLKMVLATCCCCCQDSHACTCCCATHLTTHEKMWLRSPPLNSAVIQCLLVVEHGLDTPTIKDLLYTRLIIAEKRRNQATFPRLVQKVVPFCTGYAWVYDEDFNLENHIHTLSDFIHTEEELQDFVSEMASKELNMNHPLWEVQIIHNFGPSRDTLILFRIHPCMSDSTSLVRVFLKAFVDNQPNLSPTRHLPKGRMCMNYIGGIFTGPLVFLQKWLCTKSDLNLLHGNHVHLSGRKIVAWSQPFSLSVATRVKQIARCTLNDLFMSLVAGGLRSYLQQNGIENPFNLKCIIPVNMQVRTNNMSNHYVFINSTIPTNTEGAIPRLWHVKCSMAKFKKSSEYLVLNGAMWLSSCMLPESWHDRVWSTINNHCTCLISNMAGPENVLTLDTKVIRSIMYWMPTPDQVPIAISFFTYAEQIRMAVIGDRSVLPNPEFLTKYFVFQLRQLSNLVAHRRVPGEQLCQKLENLHICESSEDMSVQQIQMKMAVVQQELFELKMRLEARSGRKISEKDMRLIRKIEQLKEELRELLVELRKRKSEEEHSLILTNVSIRFVWRPNLDWVGGVVLYFSIILFLFIFDKNRKHFLCSIFKR